jgi:hypothetical protein
VACRAGVLVPKPYRWGMTSGRLFRAPISAPPAGCSPRSSGRSTRRDPAIGARTIADQVFQETPGPASANTNTRCVIAGERSAIAPVRAGALRRGPAQGSVATTRRVARRATRPGPFLEADSPGGRPRRTTVDPLLARGDYLPGSPTPRSLSVGGEAWATCGTGRSGPDVLGDHGADHQDAECAQKDRP